MSLKFEILMIIIFINFTSGRKNLTTYEIKLDAPVDERQSKVMSDFKDIFVDVQNNNIKDLLFGLVGVTFKYISSARGKETPEFQEEIEYFANYTGIPVQGIHTIQMFYEIGTLMIPIENVNKQNFYIGCMGIIANCGGNVYHARNFDSLKFINKLMYNAIFTKGGKEIFRSGQVFGFSGVFTGFKKDYFAVEVNTRFSSHLGANLELLDNLLVKRKPLMLWEIRKTLENSLSYKDAVEKLSTLPYSAPAQNIISGIKEGCILARGADTLDHKITLGVNNPNYIIITNFDFWNNDFREYLDPTAGEIGTPRRLVAENQLDKIIKKGSQLTKENLFTAINLKGVLAIEFEQTMQQAIMNVETGQFNASMVI